MTHLSKSDHQTWFFTFGFSHPFKNRFFVIEDTLEGARDTMVKIFGTNWGFQYSEREWFDKAGVSQEKKYSLTELK